MKLDPQTRHVISHFDLRPVEIGDGCNQTQSEAVAGAIPAVLEAVEPLQHIPALVCRNARAVIGNRDAGAASIISHGNNYLLCAAAVLDCIIDEVR